MSSDISRPRYHHQRGLCLSDTRPHESQTRRPSQARTRTAPVPTRPPLERQPSQSRPSSSGNSHALPLRPSRHVSQSISVPLDEFRNTRAWPPRGLTSESTLEPGEAENLICSGASMFKGYREEVKYAPSGHYRFFAVTEAEHFDRTDRATAEDDAFNDVSLSMTGSQDYPFPWSSLEQPSMAFCFGKSPGTTTLNHYVGKFGSLQQVVQYGATVRPKKIKLFSILDRLRQLERGLKEEPLELYQNLYGSLIDDPKKETDPHMGMEQQISDLITVLSHSDWIDFSRPQNQVVAKFFDSPDARKKQSFFHQLLLSTELYLRIHSPTHHDTAKRALLHQLPPKISWDLALSQRWLANMSISTCTSAPSPNPRTFTFSLLHKPRQTRALLAFATALKWPNLAQVTHTLSEASSKQKEKPLEHRSTDALSFFSAVILPGPTLPWLLMNTLIDCDPGTQGHLKYLTHMRPAAGFQYRGNSYWHCACVVGKVLGAQWGVGQVGGWIGPCGASRDLKRTECVVVRQREAPGKRMGVRDVESMARRTEPLGPREGRYPVRDYEVLEPDGEDVTDKVRVERLRFEAVGDGEGDGEGMAERIGRGVPLTWDASVVFAVEGVSRQLCLRFDVDFVQAYPCHRGPHVLFWDYAYRAVKVSSALLDMLAWGNRQQHSLSPHSPPQTTRPADRSETEDAALTAMEHLALPAFLHVEEVLVIEALGVSHNEVFARAWCADRGHSAIVANVKETCMACAIREAYAACVSVVILTEGGRSEEDGG